MEGLTYQPLTQAQIESRLATTPGWSVDGSTLCREYGFGSYVAGVEFATKVAHVAEALDHHPDILIGYKKVRVSMSSHDAQNTLTAYDFELAKRINAIP